MPTYEYACDACGHEFDLVQKITDPPVKTCPKCHKRKAKRLIVGVNFILKGGGWYQDGYSSGPGREKKQAKEAGETEKPAETTKPSETPKPATSTKPAESTARAASKEDSPSKARDRKKPGA